MVQELIIVKQLPIIEERLRTIKEQIEARTQEALSLACTEETVKEIKKVRAELSGSFKELEAQRKAVKSKVLSPYEQFEAVYRACVTDIYAPADAELKARIDEVENAVKDEKHKEVVAFFDEYAKSEGIEFLKFDHAGIQVTLSASVKSLKAAVKKFVDRVVEELALIDTQDHKEEVLVEYKKSLNVASAITLVARRHEAVEAERKRMEEVRIAREQREAAARKVEAVAAEDAALAPPEEQGQDEETPMPLIPPKVVPADRIYSATFTVRGTLEQLKTLKTYLEDEGYEYESC
jgi:hypothetical protein